MIDDTGIGRAKNDSERLNDLERRMRDVEVKICDPMPTPAPGITAAPRKKGHGPS